MILHEGTFWSAAVKSVFSEALVEISWFWAHVWESTMNSHFLAVLDDALSEPLNPHLHMWPSSHAD